MRVVKYVLIAVGVLAAVPVAYVGYLFARYDMPGQVASFTSMTAKLACSFIFVEGRTEEAVRQQDFNRISEGGKTLSLADLKVNYDEKSVTSSLWGLHTGKAIYRKGIGCTAVMDRTEEEIRAQGEGIETALPKLDPAVQWPDGDATSVDQVPPGVDKAALDAAVEKAFFEADPAKPRATRAVLVVQGGRIVAERYAPGFDKSMGHISQSMAKSVGSALVGILVGEGKLQLKARAPVREWDDPSDPRHAITLDQLLRMSSGLKFNEGYGEPDTDTNLQYLTGDFASFTAAKPLEAAPDTKFNYSTGTSNLLGRIAREAAAPTMAEAFAFPRKALFEPLGMRTATMEVDAAGSFQFGSFFYATPRDYARFALLYMRDGVWNGTRILPEGWVAYTRTPTPVSNPQKPYGAQFWLNAGPDPKVLRWPSIPADAFFMVGFMGQNVALIPSRDLIVIRFGLTEFDNWDSSILVTDVVAAVGPAS